MIFRYYIGKRRNPSPPLFCRIPPYLPSPAFRIPHPPFRILQKPFTAPDGKDFSKKYTLFLRFQKNAISLPRQIICAER